MEAMANVNDYLRYSSCSVATRNGDFLHTVRVHPHFACRRSRGSSDPAHSGTQSALTGLFLVEGAECRRGFGSKSEVEAFKRESLRWKSRC